MALPPEIARVDSRSFSAIRSLAPKLAGTLRQSEEAVMGMKVGYARVSTTGQKLDVQMDRLADCDRIYHEKMSASSGHTRPELQKALDFVRDEDVFIVTKLDRLARSVVDLSEIVKKMQKKNVDLMVLDRVSTPPPSMDDCSSIFWQRLASSSAS